LSDERHIFMWRGKISVHKKFGTTLISNGWSEGKWQAGAVSLGKVHIWV
jgi:hypothetical protein